jgi:hypothetical protein
MEKAHGWTYVRSKNNGKNKDKQSDIDLADFSACLPVLSATMPPRK